MAPTVSQAARTLVLQEAGEAATSADVAAAAERAHQKLDVHLSRIVGEAGMRSLFGRTLALSAREYPWIPRADGIPGNAPWAHLSPQLAAQPPEVAIDAAVHIIATLIDLLAQFIGDDLTQRLLIEVWPILPAAKETT